MDPSSSTSRPLLEKRKTNAGSHSYSHPRKRIFGSVPLFKSESESETDVSPSEYIQNVLKRKVPHDRTFGVYQDDRDGSFKIGLSNFKYKDKHVFVDGRKYKTQGL